MEIEHSLIRHFQQTNTSYITFDSYPETILARVLFYLIPNVFFFIVSLNITRRSKDVTKQYNIFTLPHNIPLTFLSVLYMLITFAISTYALIYNAWTVKQWIIYGFIITFQTFSHILYASTYKLGPKSIVGSAVLAVFALWFSIWFFGELTYMRQSRKYHTDLFKTIVLLLQAVRTTFLLFQTFQIISQCFVHLLNVSHLQQIIFFWVSVLISLASIIVISIFFYGPYLQVLGFGIGGILYILPALSSTCRYCGNQQDIYVKQ